MTGRVIEGGCIFPHVGILRFVQHYLTTAMCRTQTVSKFDAIVEFDGIFGDTGT